MSTLMNIRTIHFLTAIHLFIFSMNSEAQNKSAEHSEGQSYDVLLASWSGPFGGLPPFDKVKVADFKPSLQKAVALNLSEIETIASQREPATFDNTIRAMEQSGLALERTRTIYEIWGSNMSTADFQAVEEEMEPQLAALSDKIYQNEALFKRIEAIYKGTEYAKLNAEQQRLCKLYYTNFVRSGAQLDATSKKRLAEINQQLAGLFTRFGQNLLHDEGEVFLVLDNASDLNGLPTQFIESAALAAERKSLKGKYIISKHRSYI